jgi:hypothetical protein
MNRWLRTMGVLGVLLWAAGPVQAQLGPEIARKHAARAGAKLAVLTGLRAEGRTFINKEVVPFTMIAQRPNRLRVESFTPQHRITQGYDGSGKPWVMQGDAPDGTVRDMTPGEAKDFINNADFDGPLVNFEAKGYSVDYAGEEKVEGKPAYKLLLMNKRDDVFFLWLDQESMEIVKRSVFRVFNNQRVAVDTFFKEYRPVAGVMQPHRVETVANGKTVYVMLIDKLEANPAEISAKLFVRPTGK